MPALVGHLEDWLDEQSGYPRRTDVPTIKWIDAGSARALSGVLSSAHDTTPRGFYDANARTIWLINPWSPRHPFDVSVLLHELAYHRQAADGHWYCPGAQELPAYRLQKTWLAALGLELDVNWIAIALEFGLYSAGHSPRLRTAILKLVGMSRATDQVVEKPRIRFATT